MKPARYTFKPDRYSSHSFLLDALPAHGDGRRVLDVGGGEGYLSKRLAERGYDVVCIALPGSAAPDFPRNVRLVQADLDLCQPALEAGFDAIICGDILEHLRDPAAVLRWLRGLMADGAHLLASLPNSGHAYVRWNVLLGRFPEHDTGLFDRTHLHFFTWENWQRVLTEGGFQIESVRPTAVPVRVALGNKNAGLAARALESVSYGLGHIWKTLFAYQFVVIARPIRCQREPQENRPTVPK